MDSISKEKRSWNMSRIKAKNTSPELHVRKALSKKGIRYRLHFSKLKGKPDIALTQRNIAIFVNGCFWHRHKNCKRAAEPKTNTDYWSKKIEGNIMRQKCVIQELKKIGWKTFIIWECETKKDQTLYKKIYRIIL